MKTSSLNVRPGVASRGDKRYYSHFSELSFKIGRAHV